MKGVATAILLLLFSATANADVLTVAVAANFRAAAESIAQHFSAQSEHPVRIVSGSTGKLYAQIVNGAPFDVFLSADQCTAHALGIADAAIAKTQTTYAIGTLAYWSVAQPTQTEPDWPAMRRLALANPRTAPYGAAAHDVIDALVGDARNTRYVQAENVAQVYQFITSGNVDGGFVALSQLKQSEHLGASVYWLIPQTLHRPIVQDAIITKRGAQNPAAAAFLSFLRSDATQRVLQDYGYVTAPSHANRANERCR
ncbi:MAG: molybdate ABC transporter substrate-binding protein [Pseudomonadota bacterium]